MTWPAAWLRECHSWGGDADLLSSVRVPTQHWWPHGIHSVCQAAAATTATTAATAAPAAPAMHAGAGVQLSAGSTELLLERNMVRNASFGLNVGFYSEFEYLNATLNPGLYDSRDSIIQNNIFAAVYVSGAPLDPLPARGDRHTCLVFSQTRPGAPLMSAWVNPPPSI